MLRATGFAPGHSEAMRWKLDGIWEACQITYAYMILDFNI